MGHDFENAITNDPRYCADGSNQKCTDIGGVMDYLPEVCFYFSLLFRVDEIILN